MGGALGPRTEGQELKKGFLSATNNYSAEVGEFTWENSLKITDFSFGIVVEFADRILCPLPGGNRGRGYHLLLC